MQEHTPVCTPAPEKPAETRLETGTLEFRRAVIAIAAAGFGYYLMLYVTQPLLPLFSSTFGVSPAASSLSLLSTTAGLAFALLIASPLSDRYGRRSLIVGSLLLSGIVTAVTALADDFGDIVTLRLVAGFTLAGVPAIAMAYLAEECHPRGLGMVTGMLVASNAFGSMSGRLAAGALGEHASWHWAMVAIGVTGVLLGLAAWRLLPPSRHFKPNSVALAPMLRSYRALLNDKAMLLLFFLACALMGSFVTIYNYAGYRLLLPSFGLSNTAVGAIFTLYLLGVAASLTMGRLSDRIGRTAALFLGISIMLAGVLLTLSDRLAVIVCGIAAVTFGFFGSHTVTSSWVAARAKASRAQASGLYWFSYYAGSSAIAFVGGMAWSGLGWTAVGGLAAGLLMAALGAAWMLTAHVRVESSPCRRI